jgi:uncharacterized oxidoreductase
MTEHSYQHVLITGGAGGIGQALARRFLKEDHIVTLLDQNVGDLDLIREQIPTIRTIAADVTDHHSMQRLAAILGTDPNGPDVLINNAAIHRSTPLTAPNYRVSEQVHDIDLEVRTNFTALAQICALWLPMLTARPNGAAIINVASALAFIPKYSSAVYCASKAAVELFSEVLARQVAGTNVRIVRVYPPRVATKMMAGRPFAPMMSSDQFASEFYREFQSGRETIRIGEARWLYWLHRLSPSLAARCIEA